ncbi:MAG: METTL5 family protein [Thermoplasmatota archaeon]
MRRRELEAALEAVPSLPTPSAELETYATPAGVAAEFLMLAFQEGDIEGKNVLDLGCGTGVLTIGAALLGARLAEGVEILPEALEIARQAARHAHVEATTWFVASDVAAWKPDLGHTFDTVVMNPPFGAQAAHRHADRPFYARALQAAPRVWFLAREPTEGYLSAMATEAGVPIEKAAAWDYPLPASMPFHRREVRTIRVGAYRLG